MMVKMDQPIGVTAPQGHQLNRAIEVWPGPSQDRIDTPRLSIYRDYMNVELTPDQRALVKRAIDSGRFTDEEQAVQEALALWEERERRRVEILAAIDEAEASLGKGEGRPITEESMKVLAEEIKERGRRRLAAERSVPR